LDDRKDIWPLKTLFHSPPDVLMETGERGRPEDEPADAGSPGKETIKWK